MHPRSNMHFPNIGSIITVTVTYVPNVIQVVMKLHGRKSLEAFLNGEYLYLS
jgi:hypothetical protein